MSADPELPKTPPTPVEEPERKPVEAPPPDPGHAPAPPPVDDPHPPAPVQDPVNDPFQM